MAASYAVDYFAAKRTKTPAVDKGRNDDIRIQGSDYGAMIPIIIGKGRVAPEIVWNDPIRTVVTTTPGRSGGKGAPRPPEPASNNYQYFTSLMMLVCAGPLDNGIRKIWQGPQLIYNLNGAAEITGFYEAEQPNNTLANGSSVVNNTLCSGGQAVQIGGSGPSCQFNSIDFQGTVDVTVYYITSASRTVDVIVDNVNTGTWTLPNSNGAVGTYTHSVSLPNLGNYIRFQNGSGTLGSILIDRIYIDATASGETGDTDPLRTGLVDDGATYPTDLDDPRPFYNFRPTTSGTGLTSAQSATVSARIRTYNGTSDQEIDTLLATKLGTAAQGYRNRAMLMLEELELVGGQVPQFTVEVDEGTRTVDVAVEKLFALVDVDSSSLDVTALAEMNFKGLTINSRSEVRAAIEALQIAYNFDFVEQDGLLKAVVRGGAVAATIPQAEMRAYSYGSESPKSPVLVTRIEEKTLPRAVSVNYLDPQLDFKNGTQQYSRASGKTEDNETVTLPIVLSANEAYQIAQRLVFVRHLERKQFEWTTSWKYLKLAPTDIVDLALRTVTHRVRITEMQSGLPGMIRFKGVAQDASIYTQSGIGSIGTGYERPPVETPANALLEVIDTPAFRPEDRDLLGYYVAMTGRANGRFPSGSLYEETAPGTYERVTGFPAPATMGVVLTALGTVTSVADMDSVSTVGVGLYAGELSSISEADAYSLPLNLAQLGQETIQFLTATPITTVAPYARCYRLSNFLRGRFGTEWAASPLQVKTSVTYERMTNAALAPGGGLIQTSTANAGASSIEQLERGDCYGEWLISSVAATNNVYLGLSDTDSSVAYADIVFGADQLGTSLYAIESGTLQNSGTAIHTGLAVDDRVRVSAENGVAKIYVNDVLKWTFTTPVTNYYPLRLDVSLVSQSGGLSEIGAGIFVRGGHVAGERFTLLDGAVKFRTQPEYRLGALQKLRGIVTGQAVDDAPITRVVYAGNNLRYWAPTNVQAVRSASGDITLTCERRSQHFGNWRDRQSTSALNTDDLFIFEFLDAAGIAVKGKAEAREDQGVPLYWTELEDAAGLASAGDDGSIDFTIDSTQYAEYESSTQVEGDFHFEFRAPSFAPYCLPDFIGVMPATEGGIHHYTTADSFFFTRTSFGTTTTVYIEGDAGKPVTIASNDKLSIIRTGNTVRYYKNFVSSADEPLYTSSATPLPFPYKFGAWSFGSSLSTGTAAKKCRLRRPQAIVCQYTAEQQTRDFGSVQTLGNLRLRVFQMHPVVGRGFENELFV